MARVGFLLFIVLFSIGAFSQDADSTKTTTYYFVRHAEKERHDPSEKDAHLNEQGRQRAKAWQQILQRVQFDAVYTTNFNRTKETALPTAIAKGLELIVYTVANPYTDQFIKATHGKTVLIVGHSNTIPQFVNTVIGQQIYPDIDDANNANLYIVTKVNGQMAHLVLTIN